jgi:hypothetical protein
MHPHDARIVLQVLVLQVLVLQDLALQALKHLSTSEQQAELA